MKQALMGLLILVLAVAIMVAGYYIGVIIAITGAVLTGLGIVAGVLLLICYAIWEWFQSRKQPPNGKAP